jgi:hypothetical protein
LSSALHESWIFIQHLRELLPLHSTQLQSISVLHCTFSKIMSCKLSICLCLKV